jgi:SAM-dependent methyltransferase
VALPPPHGVCGGGDPARLRGVSEAWEEHAVQWLQWARTPGHDVFFWELNLPAFAELLPAAGARTLDIGCGEGRLGRWLAQRGHRVWGIDSSVTLAAHAREAGGYEQVVCGDAATLPWPDDHFDLAIAFMSLQDLAVVEPVIAEVARTLQPGGTFCMAVVHPLNPSCDLDRYFTPTRYEEAIERDGLPMTFVGVDRPLEAYTRPLAVHGFVIEELREPRPSAPALAQAPQLEPATIRPFFLQLRCRLG